MPNIQLLLSYTPFPQKIIIKNKIHMWNVKDISTANGVTQDPHAEPKIASTYI